MSKRLLFIIIFLTNLFCVRAFAQNEINLWHSYRAEEKIALEKAVEQFSAENPDMKVNLLSIPVDAFVSKLNSAIPHNNGPDIFIWAHELVGAWSENKLIEPLPAGFIGFAREQFFDKCVEPLIWKGSLYGFPLAYKSVLLFYNKKFIEDPPATTDDMVGIAKKYTNMDEGRFGLAYETGSFYHNAAFLFGMGGSIFADENTVRLATPENIKAFEFIHDLVNVQRVVPDEATATLVTQLFNENRAVMVINGPWFLGEIGKEVEFGLAPLPIMSGTGKPAAPFLTVESVFLAANAKNPAASLKFMKWVSAGNGALLRAKTGHQPPALVSAYEIPEIAGDPLIAPFRAQLDSAIPMPNNPLMRSVWEPAQIALRRILRGTYEPGDALREADHFLAIITRPKPPQADPTFYLVILGLLLAAVCAYAVKKAYLARKEIVQAKTAYYYLLPAFVAMLVLTAVPFIVGSAVSLFAHQNGEFTFVGLSNFISILLSKNFGVTEPLSFYFTLAVTVLWTFLNVALHLCLGVVLALLLRDKWMRLKWFYRVLLIVPWAVPNYITALIWKGMFHRQFGAINGILVALGFEPVNWFSKFSTAFAANLATNTWLGFPFMMVVTLGALQSIPSELEEAASVDGAGWFDRFWNIILPLLKPALLPAVILGSVWTFNMFNIIYLVSGGEPDGSTEILISEAYRWAFSRQEQYGYAAAYAVLIFVVLFGYSKLTDRFLKPRQES